MTSEKKNVVMLATIHENQMKGRGNNSFLEQCLKYLTPRLGVQIVMEEWSGEEDQSVAKDFAESQGLHWANVGTPEEEEFRTYRAGGLISRPEYDGTLPTNLHAPQMREYGPFENQEARENRMAANARAEMEGYETGLFICGTAHLHSLFAKLRQLGFEVTAFSFI